MSSIHRLPRNEVLPGAPFALRQHTATQLERLARENPRAAAAQRIAADFQTALEVIQDHQRLLEAAAETDADW